MSIDIIKLWHERARPAPTEEDLNVQFGCHVEEFVEMLDTISVAEAGDIDFASMMYALDKLSTGLKNGTIEIQIDDRKEFLDSAADQIVTATGVAHCAEMNISEAVRRVNTSNWSKYNKDGQPIFDKNGKIMKGPDYVPPDLEGLY